jgi:hypothetical protein
VERVTRMTIESFPAYDIIASTDNMLDADNDMEMPILRHGKTYAIQFESRRHGLLWHIFRAGTVIDYAREYSEDPVEAVQTATTLGHRLVWLNPVPVMLTSSPQHKGYHVGLKWDQVVFFDGKRYQIKPTHNNNIKLKEYFK